MALNKVSGDMYNHVTHTWNFIKGKCPHTCSYCYMKTINKRFNKTIKDTYLDEKEFKINPGKKRIIFIGSSNDMWADEVCEDWIYRILKYTRTHWNNNKYLFQTKNPKRFIDFLSLLPPACDIGTTIETNRQYGYMGNAPEPIERARALLSAQVQAEIGDCNIYKTFVTIEPIIDFDLDLFLPILKMVNPNYINIGADSENNHLPEPPKEKIIELINELEKFTHVNKKPNLNRLLKRTA